MEEDHCFSAHQICKSHGKKQFLQDISLAVSQGECLGVLGDNGSGKSTLMAILAATATPDSGEIQYNHAPITKIDRRKIGYVPQQPALLEELSVKENLALWQSVYRRKGDMLEFVPPCLKLEEMLYKKVQHLSGGMQKKLAIAIALMNNPNVLILDEAFAALDSKCVRELGVYLQEASHMAIIYSSHNIYEITKLCTKAMVLKDGQVNYQTQEPIPEDSVSIEGLYAMF